MFLGVGPQHMKKIDGDRDESEWQRQERVPWSRIAQDTGWLPEKLTERREKEPVMGWAPEFFFPKEPR